MTSFRSGVEAGAALTTALRAATDAVSAEAVIRDVALRMERTEDTSWAALSLVAERAAAEWLPRERVAQIVQECRP